MSPTAADMAAALAHVAECPECQEWLDDMRRAEEETEWEPS